MSLRPLRWLGVSALVLGALLVLNFLATRNNPSVALGDLGILALLLGGVAISADGLGVGRSSLRTNGWTLTASGWVLLSLGLLVAVSGLLLEDQVSCSCPAFGACDCGAALYGVMLDGGVLAAFLGIAATLAGRMSSRKSATSQRVVKPDAARSLTVRSSLRIKGRPAPARAARASAFTATLEKF